jgi:hypothetical protein
MTMPSLNLTNIVISCSFLLLAHPALAQKVKVDYDKAVNFSTFKTYTWVKGIPAKNPIINQMIIDAVDREMVARGLTKKEADGDLQDLFSAAAEFDLQVPPSTWRNTSPSSQQTGIGTAGQAYDVRKGTVLVDMMQTSTKNIVWRGNASQTLTQKPSGNAARDAQKVEKLIKKSVEKMFQKYPVPTRS